MNNYEIKKQARIDRLRERAEKARTESDSRWAASKQISDRIPFGQPILVGHHSEKRHRSDLKKIETNDRKAYEAGKKAEELDCRADSAENNNIIQSEDPKAIQKLKSRLLAIQHQQETYKAINKIVRKKKLTVVEKVNQIMETVELKKEDAVKLLVPDCCGGIGIQSYELRNNNANMKRIKQRIKQLESVKGMETTSDKIGDIEIVRDVEDMRIRLIFNGKPEENVRTELKRNGFRWSPYNKAWQRQLNNNGEWAVKQFLEFYSKL